MKTSSKIVSTGKERILKFECENCDENPNIGKNPSCMEEVNTQLEKKNAKISSLILKGKYIQEYKNEDLEFLKEFSQTLKISKYLIQRQKTLKRMYRLRKRERKTYRKNLDQTKKHPSRRVRRFKTIQTRDQRKTIPRFKKVQKV